MQVTNLKSVRIKVASPKRILSWSHGEITKPETINYRTQRAEKDGLFCQKIFGPEKDYECYCGKYKKIRYKGLICDRCGVEVTKSSVRRERMGHITLASPCSHIWFLKGLPSMLGTVLGLSVRQLEQVIYFPSFIITKVYDDAKEEILEKIDKEYKAKVKDQINGIKSKIKREKIKKELKVARDKAKEEISSVKVLKILSEPEYHNFSLKYGEAFEAGTGSEVLRKILEDFDLEKEIENMKVELKNTKSVIKRNKILRRLKIIQHLQRADLRPEWMFLTVLPVLPCGLRPMVQLGGGRYASSDLNDLYRRVINRNNRLKYLLEISAPQVIVRNEKRILQEAVDALIDNGMRKGTTTRATTGGRRALKSLADILKGKQGRFRQNLLGKRVDYSGRSVIVVGPKLKLDECGIPKIMALELFKPFVIKGILDKELAYNVRKASKLIDEKTDEVWAILEEAVKDKLVLLNRAPTLHRLGIQAFKPLLIEGEAIRLHPLVCRAFNADFDGDQMSVHLPLSKEAQKEAREIILSTKNILKPATGMPIINPSQDIVLGCYWLTDIVEGSKGEGKYFESPEEAKIAFELDHVKVNAKVNIRGVDNENNKDIVEISVGRVLFNETLPKDYPLVNELIDSGVLKKIIGKIINEHKYDIEEIQNTLDRIKNLGFEYSGKSGITWGMGDLITPKEKPGIIKEAEEQVGEIDKHFQRGLLSRGERRSKVIEIWTNVKAKIEKLVPEQFLKTNPVFQIINSGSRGSWSQPVQMSGMKGLVINPAGEIMELPIKSSYKEGFNVLEYFISTHGARKGTSDTALRTASAGYLTRRLVDVAHELITQEEDCGDKKGIVLFKKTAEEINQNFILKIVGRVNLEEIKSSNKVIVKVGEIIDWRVADIISKDKKIEEVRTRSPLTCKSKRGICRKCYGWDTGTGEFVNLGVAVGVIAAQAIGEPGTQLTMKTFHTGGVASGGDITSGLPRVQEILEVRSPGGKAEMALEPGKVLSVDSEEGIIKIETITEKEEENKDIEKSKKGKLKKKDKLEVLEYKAVSNSAIWVNKGEIVKKGQQLFEGSLNLKELFDLTDEYITKFYIINEIQKVYCSQGVSIHDKHLELIVKQMFSRIKVTDFGDSFFSIGEVVEKSTFMEENEELKKKNKKLVKGEFILLGISKVALSTDSFLSAASFQETSRVLIKAAIQGKVDRLRGLKENVIIGKLIPVGTGFKK